MIVKRVPMFTFSSTVNKKRVINRKWISVRAFGSADSEKTRERKKREIKLRASILAARRAY